MRCSCCALTIESFMSDSLCSASIVLVCGRLSTDLFARLVGDEPCMVLGTTYGKPHLWAIVLCLCTGLWWPFVKVVRPDSDWAVSARGLLRPETDEGSSESDSRTGSRCSFLRAQEHLVPWVHPQFSATSRIRRRSLSLPLPKTGSPEESPSCVQAPLWWVFSPPQSQRTCAERDLRRVRQWAH
jgi:hypothetical protein